MKAKSLFILVTLLLFLLSSCEKDATLTDTLDPELSGEDLEILDSTSVVPLADYTVIIPSRQT